IAEVAQRPVADEHRDPSPGVLARERPGDVPRRLAIRHEGSQRIEVAALPRPEPQPLGFEYRGHGLLLLPRKARQACETSTTAAEPGQTGQARHGLAAEPRQGRRRATASAELLAHLLRKLLECLGIEAR